MECLCGSSSVVERLLAKEKVAGSTPVCRSIHKTSTFLSAGFCIIFLVWVFVLRILAECRILILDAHIDLCGALDRIAQILRG